MDERDYKAMNEELNPSNANNVLAIVAFIEAEIPKIEAERNKYKEPYNHSMYINTDRRLDAAKLFLEWVVSNYH
jgi:hypothetical protein